MANRGVICPTCGFVRRAACESLRGVVGEPPWPAHCDTPMLILGYRQSQAVTQLAAADRVRWVALGGPVRQGRGHKRWVPILSPARLGERFPSG